MRRVLNAIFAIAVSSGAAYAQAPNLGAMDFVVRSVPDGPVARVNGKSIPGRDFVAIYRTELARAQSMSGKSKIPDEARLELGLVSLGVLIQRELVYQQAVKEGLEIPEEKLDEAWSDQLVSLRKTFVREEDSAMSDAELLDELGISSESGRADLEKMLLVDAMRDRIVTQKGVAITDEDVAKVYEESKRVLARPDTYHLQQIFVAISNAAGGDALTRRANARAKAEKALDLVLAGQRFDRIAEQYSESPDRKRGGDMGKLAAGQLPEFMAAEAQQLQPNEVSDVFESEFGYHILKLLEYIPGAEPSLEKAAPFLRRRLHETKGEQIVRDYCDALIQSGESEIEVFLDIESSIYADPSLRHLLQKDE